MGSSSVPHQMPTQAAALASSEIDRCIFIPAKEVEEREQAAQV